jgi:hypothetical protein
MATTIAALDAKIGRATRCMAEFDRLILQADGTYPASVLPQVKLLSAKLQALVNERQQQLLSATTAKKTKKNKKKTTKAADDVDMRWSVDFNDNLPFTYQRRPPHPYHSNHDHVVVVDEDDTTAAGGSGGVGGVGGGVGDVVGRHGHTVVHEHGTAASYPMRYGFAERDETRWQEWRQTFAENDGDGGGDGGDDKENGGGGGGGDCAFCDGDGKGDVNDCVCVLACRKHTSCRSRAAHAQDKSMRHLRRQLSGLLTVGIVSVSR